MMPLSRFALPFVLVLVLSSSLACSSSAPTDAAPTHKDPTGIRTQENYETLAILGVLMIGVEHQVEQTPDPAAQAKVDQLGKSSLQALFKVDPDRVELTAQGLVVH